MKKVALGVALLGLLALAEVRAESFLGFRLLDLEGRLVKWSSTELGRGAVVTYAFVAAPMRFPGARNCDEIGSIDPLLANSAIAADVFRTEVAAAFAMWEAVANIRFRETNDPATAGILVGAQGIPMERAFANVTYRAAQGAVTEIERALVCLNPTVRWKIGFDGNIDVYDLRYTVAHEIGHAIGLDHPTPSGVLMSYRYDERFRELQRGDVEGAVALYGMRKHRPGTATVTTE